MDRMMLCDAVLQVSIFLAFSTNSRIARAEQDQPRVAVLSPFSAIFKTEPPPNQEDLAEDQELILGE